MVRFFFHKMEINFTDHGFAPQEYSEYSQEHEEPPSAHLQELNPTDLAMIFAAADKDNDGEIGARELQATLSSATLMSFNLSLCELLINMFDRHGKGSVQVDDFIALWKYINDWSNSFRSFDVDGSGNINQKEFTTALGSFGYNLNPTLTNLLMFKFDRHGEGTLRFDDFVQCCIILHSVSGAFRNMDRDRDGFITISYEQFISIVVSIAINR
ncbi:unnamed protein product [Allacma fusca]|uniref:EF-hand domain-containing protein n=1 Tax=Allacma fusca TaxID=39272 RepID=A0A8J2PQ84_9HEXA|nr:unnamed protein product [Allacma fusca]